MINPPNTPSSLSVIKMFCLLRTHLRTLVCHEKMKVHYSIHLVGKTKESSMFSYQNNCFLTISILNRECCDQLSWLINVHELAIVSWVLYGFILKMIRIFTCLKIQYVQYYQKKLNDQANHLFK